MMSDGRRRSPIYTWVQWEEEDRCGSEQTAQHVWASISQCRAVNSSHAGSQCWAGRLVAWGCLLSPPPSFLSGCDHQESSIVVLSSGETVWRVAIGIIQWCERVDVDLTSEGGSSCLTSGPVYGKPKRIYAFPEDFGPIYTPPLPATHGYTHTTQRKICLLRGLSSPFTCIIAWQTGVAWRTWTRMLYHGAHMARQQWREHIIMDQSSSLLAAAWWV